MIFWSRFSSPCLFFFISLSLYSRISDLSMCTENSKIWWRNRSLPNVTQLVSARWTVWVISHHVACWMIMCRVGPVVLLRGCPSESYGFFFLCKVWLDPPLRLGTGSKNSRNGQAPPSSTSTWRSWTPLMLSKHWQGVSFAAADGKPRTDSDCLCFSRICNIYDTLHTTYRL